MKYPFLKKPVSDIRLNLLFFIILLMLSGCRKSAPINVDISKYEILSETRYPSFQNLCCMDLLVDESQIIIDDWCSDSSFLKVYSYFPLEKVSSFGKKGRGPGEYLSPFFFNNIVSPASGFSFRTYDLNLRISHEYELSDLAFVPNTEIHPVQKDRLSENIFPCLNLSVIDSCYYGTEINSVNGLFFIYNKATNKRRWIDFEPKDFYKSHHLPDQCFVYSNRLVANKDQKKIVSAMKYFNQIIFYSINGDYLKSVSIGENNLPFINDNNVSVTSDSYLYCFDLYGTRDFVYALWGGQKYKDYELNTIIDSFVVVFNWDGDFIKTYKISRSNLIGISPDDKFLFASKISADGTTEIVSYELGK